MYSWGGTLTPTGGAYNRPGGGRGNSSSPPAVHRRPSVFRPGRCDRTFQRKSTHGFASRAKHKTAGDLKPAYESPRKRARFD